MDSVLIPPPPPPPDARLAVARPSAETLSLLASRRSAPLALLSDPGPDDAQTRELLRLAMRCPDHRKLAPWRFIVFSGAARYALGDIFAAALSARDGAPDPDRMETERARAVRAPVIVAVISSPVEDTKGTPQWEQELSAGAVCQTLLVAACAMGWGACWITEWPAYDVAVKEGLGLTARERIAGFIYIGTVREPALERARPNPDDKITVWARP
jgi:nitroreductase